MTTLVYLSPIALVIGLIASGRVKLIHAGLAGLAATLAATYVALPDGPGYATFLATEGLRGSWLAWHNIAIIFAGLTLHHLIEATAPPPLGAERPAAASRHREAFLLCFIASGVVECAVGFGIGFALAIQGLRRLGTPVHAAVALGFLSQMLVPWGALGIGTVIGAALGDLPLDSFGMTSALVMLPFMLGLLVWFWLWSWRLGFGLSAGNMAIDIAWSAALLMLLYAGNRFVSVDTAGLVATAPLLALAWLLDRSRTPWRRALRLAAPYLLLGVILLTTRLIKPLQAWLQGSLVFAPYPDMPAFALPYHGASMLLLAALLYGAFALRSRSGWAAILQRSWRAGRIAMSTTLIFLVMAQLMGGAGIPAALAAAWQSVAGDYALLATPVFAATAGGLTGGNTASNSLLLPLQAALAHSVGASVLWVSALQNVTGAMFTSFAPGKLALACAFAEWRGGERQAYRTVLPLGLILLPIALGVAALL